MKKFVDTNIFIYSLFPVDKKKYKQCLSLFKFAAKGKIDLWTTEWVMAELVWFLRRKKITLVQCKEILFKTLATKGLIVRNKNLILEVLDIWQDPLSFTDAIHLINLKHEVIKEGYSFDKDFEKIDWFKRLEP